MRNAIKIWSIFITGLLALSIVVSANAQSAAEDPEGARAFIEELSANAIAVLDDTSITQDEREAQFRALLAEHFDLRYIGRLVLGRHRRTASQAQRARYDEIFPEYVLKIYANRLTERGDEEFVVDGTAPAGRRDIFVRTRIVRPDGPPVAADWRVRLNEETFRVVDLKVEGISMAITQRDEFAAKISSDGLDALLDDLALQAQLSRDDEVETLEAASSN